MVTTNMAAASNMQTEVLTTVIFSFLLFMFAL